MGGHDAAAELLQTPAVDAIEKAVPQQEVESADDGEPLAVDDHVVEIEGDGLLVVVVEIGPGVQPFAHAVGVAAQELHVLVGSVAPVVHVLAIDPDSETDHQPAPLLPRVRHDVLEPVLVTELVGRDPPPVQLRPLGHPLHAVDDHETGRGRVPPHRLLFTGDDVDVVRGVEPEAVAIEPHHIDGGLHDQPGAVEPVRGVHHPHADIADLLLQHLCVSHEEQAETLDPARTPGIARRVVAGAGGKGVLGGVVDPEDEVVLGPHAPVDAREP